MDNTLGPYLPPRTSEYSRASIHRHLKSHSLKPYRNKYFLQICDPHFFEKMEKILKVYTASYPYLFCLDEWPLTFQVTR